jgi:signal transduction histidine kinase
MTVVVGHARMLQQDAQADAVTDAAETIDRSASELIDVGEKAREFETLRERGPQYRSVSVGETVERAVAEGRPDESDQGDADATGRVDVTVDDATVRTDPKLCSLVVENLVENAVEHSSTSPPSSSTRENALEHVDDPTVVVTATVGDDELCLTVEDDGPGIPPGELAPLESGGETSLEHGGGIGLWIVEWCVTSLGGSWSVETDDGTTVTVRLPDGRTETV